MAALGATVPDVPEDVSIQLQRTVFLSSKVSPKDNRKAVENSNRCVMGTPEHGI